MNNTLKRDTFKMYTHAYQSRNTQSNLILKWIIPRTKWRCDERPTFWVKTNRRKIWYHDRLLGQKNSTKKNMWINPWYFPWKVFKCISSDILVYFLLEWPLPFRSTRDSWQGPGRAYTYIDHNLVRDVNWNKQEWGLVDSEHEWARL